LTSLAKLSVIDERTVPAGAGVLALAVVALAVAVYPLRSRRAIALAALSLTAAATVAYTYGQIPALTIRMTTRGLGNLRYLMAPMYVVGVLTWLTTGTILALACRWAVRKVKSRDMSRGNHTASTAPRVGGVPWAVPAMTIAAVAVMALAALAATEIGSVRISQIRAMRAVTSAAQRIEPSVSRRQLALSVLAATNPQRRQVTFGLVYALHTLGYSPQISQRWWAQQLGHLYLFRGRPMTHVNVLIRGGSLSVSVVGMSTGTDATGESDETPLLLMAGPVIGQHAFARHKVVAADLSKMNSNLAVPMDLILGYPTIRQADWLFTFRPNAGH
jgi:hypothetical protein